MNLPSKKDYKDIADRIKSELPRGAVDDFIDQYYPEYKGDKVFSDKLRNCLYGRSWEAAYIEPGFFPQLIEYLESRKIKLNSFLQSKSKSNE